jgi:predicted NBD/HSP70 family sugar kinase
MPVSVGIDIAKEVHWITAIDECGEIRLDHRLDNAPTAIEALIGGLRALERRHHRQP